jgi:hypothetical protein
MNNYRFRITLFFYTALAACFYAFFLAPETAVAATVNEITAMHDAGIPPEVMIEVLDATGIDEEVDEDTIVYLWDCGVDQDVIEFIIQNFLPDKSNPETEAPLSGDENLEDRPNFAGGLGFNHDGNPYQYWDGPSYTNDNYWPQYITPYNGVTVYQPPVYIIPGYPYCTYQAPRYNRYHRGYWDNGRYVIYENYYDTVYDPNAPSYNPYYGGRGYWGNNYRCVDQGWEWRANFDGNFFYDGHDSWFDGSFDGYYRDDGVRIRFDF